ncbi:MAG: alpha/beta fold hydrolase, partial [Leptospirales bacterium]
SFSFRTGERLGSILGGAGYHNLRFDHRGTGDTSASPRTRLDLDLMAADVLSVARDGRKRFKPATIRVEASNTPPQNRATSLFLLAHDSGCALTLRAIKNDLIKNPAIDGSKGARRDALPTGVILLACDLSGALLDQWGRQLLYNMRRQNVDPDIVTRAEGEWSRFRKDGSLPLKEIAATEKPPPDLVAFREALRFMASEEMRDFRATAAAIDLEGSARTLLRRGIPVLHLIGTMDAELPPESIQAMRSLAASLAKTGPYRFHLIPAMNHFLKEQQQDLRGPGLALERMNPFRIIHPTAIRLIREFIETHSRNL